MPRGQSPRTNAASLRRSSSARRASLMSSLARLRAATCSGAFAPPPNGDAVPPKRPGPPPNSELPGVPPRGDGDLAASRARCSSVATAASALAATRVSTSQSVLARASSSVARASSRAPSCTADVAANSWLSPATAAASCAAKRQRTSAVRSFSASGMRTSCAIHSRKRLAHISTCCGSSPSRFRLAAVDSEVGGLPSLLRTGGVCGGGLG